MLFYFFFTFFSLFFNFKLYSLLCFSVNQAGTVLHPGVFHTGAHTHLPTRILRLPLGLSFERSLQNRPAGTTPVGLISRTAVCKFHRFDWNVCLDRHAAPTQVTDQTVVRGFSQTAIRAFDHLHVDYCISGCVNGLAWVVSLAVRNQTAQGPAGLIDDRSNQGVAG